MARRFSSIRLGTCRRALSCSRRRAGGWLRCLPRGRGPVAQPPPVGTLVVPDPCVVGVLPAHDGRPGGAAQRGGDERLAKCIPVSATRAGSWQVWRSSVRMSSARTKTKFGFPGAAWAEASGLSKTEAPTRSRAGPPGPPKPEAKRSYSPLPPPTGRRRGNQTPAPQCHDGSIQPTERRRISLASDKSARCAILATGTLSSYCLRIPVRKVPPGNLVSNRVTCSLLIADSSARVLVGLMRRSEQGRREKGR